MLDRRWQAAAVTIPCARRAIFELHDEVRVRRERLGRGTNRKLPRHT